MRRDIADSEVLGLDAHEGNGRAAAGCLVAVMSLLPFEPRRPALLLPGFEITLLELVAALSLAALAWTGRRRLPLLLRSRPWPLLLLGAYAATHLLSAAFAPTHGALALKFSLRMLAMAAFAATVAAAPLPAHRKGLLALCVSAGVVAVLAVLEGLGVRALDPFLGLFREMPFNVAGSRRASAGSEYPNLAAAIILYGLMAGVALAAGLRRRLGAVLAGSLLASGGLLFTYSRGALVAAALGLLCLAAALHSRRAAVRLPLLAVLVLAVSSTAFAWHGEIFRLRLGSEGTGAWYAARYEPTEAALRLTPGEQRVTSVRVTNTGRKTWAVAESFHLSYHWYDAERRFLTDGPRTRLPRDVRSGESVALDARVRAPMQEGRYLLVWDMVHERTTWFSGQGVTPATVVAVVSARAATAAAPAAPPVPGASLAWRPSRSELWRIALALWRERPLTGVGSDNFRWLHGPKAGQAFWDSRIFANNTLLEAAATTGTLGLLALGGSLAATLIRALRRVKATDPGTPAGAEAAGLLALAAALTAHGTVDYVLAFTGHYLLFGFVVGAVSAPAAEVAA